MKLRAGQAEFWNKYIAPPSDYLAQLWDKNGNLNRDIALASDGNLDTACERMLEAVDEIKRKLEEHQIIEPGTAQPRRLVDDPQALKRFFKSTLRSCMLSVTELVGGGEPCRADAFIAANDIGMFINDYDMIRARVLGEICGFSWAEANRTSSAARRNKNQSHALLLLLLLFTRSGLPTAPQGGLG